MDGVVAVIGKQLVSLPIDCKFRICDSIGNTPDNGPKRGVGIHLQIEGIGTAVRS